MVAYSYPLFLFLYWEIPYRAWDCGTVCLTSFCNPTTRTVNHTSLMSGLPGDCKYKQSSASVNHVNVRPESLSIMNISNSLSFIAERQIHKSVL